MKFIVLALALLAAGCGSTRTYTGNPALAHDRPFSSQTRPLDQWMLEDAPLPTNERRANDLQFIAGLIAAVQLPLDDSAPLLAGL